ncbi:MAG: hypothetical protein KatS3mg077_0595 [Candidatus Binatia bacterium]|nr:MAG: hypothetical protein KatS3mg077_0595 [Candidatus Binatia bacterium]
MNVMDARTQIRKEAEPKDTGKAEPRRETDGGRVARWTEQMFRVAPTSEQYQKWVDRLIALGLIVTLALAAYIFLWTG